MPHTASAKRGTVRECWAPRRGLSGGWLCHTWHQFGWGRDDSSDLHRRDLGCRPVVRLRRVHAQRTRWESRANHQRELWTRHQGIHQGANSASRKAHRARSAVHGGDLQNGRRRHDPWNRRFASKFAIVYAAAKMAAELKLAPWEPKHPFKCVERLYRRARALIVTPEEAAEQPIRALLLATILLSIRLSPHAEFALTSLGASPETLCARSRRELDRTDRLPSHRRRQRGRARPLRDHRHAAPAPDRRRGTEFD